MNNYMRVMIFSAFVVCGLWVLFLLITLALGCSGAIQSFGNMGDAFGMLNTLFAGLGLAAILAQLWMQQMQIDHERNARQSAERISALTTLIQLTYEKLRYERKLLLEIAPEFNQISFLHDKDIEYLLKSIKIRESSDAGKEAIPLMKQIVKLVNELQLHEAQIKNLLNGDQNEQTDHFARSQNP